MRRSSGGCSRTQPSDAPPFPAFDSDRAQQASAFRNPGRRSLPTARSTLVEQESRSMSSRIPRGCPFIDQQNIGGHAPEPSDRHCTGRPDSIWAEARAYMELYHREKKIPERLASRLEAVRHEIECTGTYWQTADELAHGARVAWRNSNRCIGRLYWESLQLRDMRHLATEEEIFQSCANIFAWRTTLAKSGRP